MAAAQEFERVEVASAGELRAWLEANHARREGAWLVTYKKHAGDRYVSVGEILDEVLCFGWIDGVRRRLDGDRTMQLISPRRTLRWAQTYKDRAARLEGQGRMRPAGLAAIAESKRAGMWDATAEVDALVVPGDLVEALAACPPAARNFAAFPASYRRNVLRWVGLAKRPETRAERVGRAAASAARKEKLPQM